MKSSFMLLYIITWVIALANKMPILRYVIGIFSIWYGKTTWWKILVKLRKVFIVINAIIGFVIVFKTTGFEPGLILSNIGMMGANYVEILTNFSRRLFNWLLDLLGYRIEPTDPSIPGIKRPWYVFNGWHPHLNHESWYDKLHKFDYKNLGKYNELLSSINIRTDYTPWYKDFSTWMWIIGAVTFIGIGYIGYKFIYDPSFIENLPTFKKTGPTPPPSDGGGFPGPITGKGVEIGGINNTGGGEISLAGKTVAATTQSLKTIVNVTKISMGYLNPYNWFTSAAVINEQANAFNQTQ